MRLFRTLIAFACLAVAAMAPPAMAAPPGFSNEPAYASPIDQGNPADFAAIAAVAPVNDADARTSGAKPDLASIHSTRAPAGASIDGAAFAHIDPGRGFG